MDLEEERKTPNLANEEAFGYNITRNIVCDKDCFAAAMMAQLIVIIYEEKNAIGERLQ